MKNEIVRLGLILCVISLIASGLLAMVNDVTTPIIAAQQAAANDAARKQIIPEADSFEEVQGEYGENVTEKFFSVIGWHFIIYKIKVC